MPDKGAIDIDYDQTKRRKSAESQPTRLENNPASAANPELAEVGFSNLMFPRDALVTGRGNAPLRSATFQSRQNLHGNRAVQRQLRGRSLEAESLAEVAEGKENVVAPVKRDSGSQLDGLTRTFLEHSLGSDLSGVHVHHDSEADRLARSVDAFAFTSGQDIFFRSGSYKPGLPDGLQILAHEVTHTVQHGLAEDKASGRAALGQPVSKRADSSEVEAEKVASQAIAGERPSISTTPSASVSRFGWSDALSMGFGGVVGEVASPFIGPAPTDPGAAAPPKDEGVWDKLKRGWSGEEKREQKLSGEIDSARHESIDNTVDWLEGQAHKGGQMGVEATAGIPVLNELAKANAAVGDFGTEVAGGFIKGAGGFLGSLGEMAANPIGTAKGLWAMSTHIPGIGLPSKILDKGIDVATGDKKLGDAFDETLGAKAGSDDLNFWKNVGGHFLKPYGEAIDKGKYGEVGGRAIFDIGSLVLGAGEASTASKAAETGDAANAASKVVDAAEGAKGIPKSVPPPSGVPTVRNPTPIVEPPGSVPPSKLVPETPPGTIPPPPEIVPPAPSKAPPTIPASPTDIPAAPVTKRSPVPSDMPSGPITPHEFPTPSQAPKTIPDPVTPPSTNPAPSQPPAPTIPSPAEELPTHHPPSPGELQNPVIPKQPEPPGWGERLLQEERELGERYANPDYDWFWKEVEKLKR